MPANEGRCCVFKVKENKQKEFEEYFNKHYLNNFKLYSKKNLLIQVCLEQILIK